MGYKRALNMKKAAAALIFALLPLVGGNLYASVGCENSASQTYCISPYTNPGGSAQNTSPAFSPAWTKVSSDEYKVGGGQYIQFQVEKGTIYKWSTEGSEDVFQGTYSASCNTNAQCGYRLECQGGYCILPFHTELTLFGGGVCGVGGENSSNVLAYSREGSFYNQAEIEWKADVSGTVTLLITNYEYQKIDNGDGTFDNNYVPCQPTSGTKTTTVKWQRSVAEHCTECDEANKYAYNATVEMIQERDDSDNLVYDELGNVVEHEGAYTYNPKALPTDGSAYAPYWNIIQSSAPQSAANFSNYDDWIKPGSYIVFSVVEGQIYRWSTCATEIYDTQLTLFKGKGKTGDCGDFLAYGDDSEVSYRRAGDTTNYCPAGTKQTVLEWHANFTGEVTLLFNEYNCYQCAKREIGSHWAHCYETRENEEHNTEIYPMPLEWQRYDCMCVSNENQPLASIADTCGVNSDDDGNGEKTCPSKWDVPAESENFSGTIENVSYGRFAEFSLRRGSKYLFKTQDSSALITIKKLDDTCKGKTLAQGKGELAYFADSTVPEGAEDNDPNHYPDQIIVLVTKADCNISASESTKLYYSFYSDPLSSDAAQRFERSSVNDYSKFIDNSPNGLSFLDTGKWAKTWQEAMEVCSDSAFGTSTSGIVQCPDALCPDGRVVPSVLANDPATKVWCPLGLQGQDCARPGCRSSYTEYKNSGTNKGKCYYDGSCNPTKKDNICLKYKNHVCLRWDFNVTVCDTSNAKCVDKDGICGSGAYSSSYMVGVTTGCNSGYEPLPDLMGCYRYVSAADTKDLECDIAAGEGHYDNCDKESENVDPSAATCSGGYNYVSNLDACQNTDSAYTKISSIYVHNGQVSDTSKCYKGRDMTHTGECRCGVDLEIFGSSGTVRVECPKPECPSGYTYHREEDSVAIGQCYKACGDGYTLVDGTDGRAHCYKCDSGYELTEDEDGLNGWICAQSCSSGQILYEGACYRVGSTGSLSCDVANGWIQDPNDSNKCRKTDGYVKCSGTSSIQCDNGHPGCDTSEPNSDETWCYRNHCGEDFRTDENLRVCPDVEVTLDGNTYNLSNYEAVTVTNEDGTQQRVCEVELPTGTCGKPLGSWVLPNINQLYSIVDFDLHDPATAMPFVGNTYVRDELNKSCAPTADDLFGDKQCGLPGRQGDGHWICMDGQCVRNNWYWSSTTVVNGSDEEDGEFVWSINMEDGRSYRAPKGCVDNSDDEGETSDDDEDLCAGVTFNSRPHKVLCVKGSYYAGLFDAGLPAKEQTFSGWVCNKSNEEKSLTVYFDIVDSSGVNKEGKNVVSMLADNDSVITTLPGSSRKVFIYGQTEIKPEGTVGKALAIYNNCAAVGQDPATVAPHAFELKFNGTVSAAHQVLADTIKSIADLTKCTAAQIAANNTANCVVPPFFVTAYAADPETPNAIAFEISPVHQPFVFENVCGDSYQTFDGDFLETCEIDDFDSQCAYGDGTCPYCPQDTCVMEDHPNPKCGDGTIQSSYCGADGKIEEGHEGAGLACKFYNFDNPESSENCDCGDGRSDTMYLYESGEVKCDPAHLVTTTSCPVYNQDCEICASCGKIQGNRSFCGDGFVQNADCSGLGENCITMAGAAEECDSRDPNFCSPECKLPKCGDGYIQNDEFCDDGEHNGEYGKCNESCTDHVRCGDGIAQSGYEVCDLGDGHNGAAIRYSDFINFRDENDVLINQDCAQKINDVSYPVNRAQGDKYKDCVVRYAAYLKENPGCSADCQTASVSACGDNHKDTQRGEQCDEGLPVNADGTFNEALTEEDKYNGKSYYNCALDCQEYSCGDNVLETYAEGAEYDSIGTVDASGKVNLYVFGANEKCDDGAKNGRYGACANDCQGWTRCGNKKVEDIDTAAGLTEQCDNGPDNLSIELGYSATQGNACISEDADVCKGPYSGWSLSGHTYRCCEFGRYCGDGNVDNGEGVGTGSESQDWRLNAEEDGTWTVDGVSVGYDPQLLSVKFTKTVSGIATAELQTKLPVNKNHRSYLEYDFEVKNPDTAANAVVLESAVNMYKADDTELAPNPDQIDHRAFFKKNPLDETGYNVWAHVRSAQVKGASADGSVTQFVNDTEYVKIIFHFKGNSGTQFFVKGLKFYAVETLLTGENGVYGFPRPGSDSSKEMCDPGTANFKTTSARYMTDCNSSCEWINFCGDGKVQRPGSCDSEGLFNGFECEPNITGSAEVCDKGQQNAPGVYNGCEPGCLELGPRCGDNIVDITGSACDPSDNRCSNPIGLAKSEQCDGNRCFGDPSACLPNSNSRLVDGDGSGADFTNLDNYGVCREDCMWARCGDGILDEGEECDCGILGSPTRTTESTSWQKDEETGTYLCHNGTTESNGTTQYYNTNQKVNRSLVCRSNCRISRCGDGILDREEACDDGNLNDNDSCIGCKLAFCGDTYFSDTRSYLCEELREIANEPAVKAWRDKGVIDCVNESGHANSCSEFVNMSVPIDGSDQYNDEKLVQMFKAGYLHCCYDRKLEGLPADNNCWINDGTPENPQYKTPAEKSYTPDAFEGCDSSAPKSKAACETYVGLLSSDPKTQAACATVYAPTSDEYKACIAKVTKYNDCVNSIEKNTYCSTLEGIKCREVIGRCGDGKLDQAAGEKCDKYYVGASFDNAGKYQKLDGSWENSAVSSTDPTYTLATLGRYCTGDWVGTESAKTTNAPMCGGSITDNCWSDGCTVKWHAPGGNDSDYSKQGDGKVDKYAGEECDMGTSSGKCGGNSKAYYCGENCKFNGASCGDGLVQATQGGGISAEVCDTVANITAYDTCIDECKYAQNNVTNYGISGGEEGCKKACVYAGYCVDNCKKSFGYCGDGEIHAPQGSPNIEDFDLLTYNAAKDGGPEDCDNEDPRTKSLASVTPLNGFCNGCKRVGTCGDGTRNPRFEACDCTSGFPCTVDGRTCKENCKMDSFGALLKANSVVISGWACDPDHPLAGKSKEQFIKLTFEYDNNGTATNVGTKYMKVTEDVDDSIILQCGGDKTHGWKTDLSGVSWVNGQNTYTVKAYAFDFDVNDYVFIGEKTFGKKKSCGDGVPTACNEVEVILADGTTTRAWDTSTVCNDADVYGDCQDYGLTNGAQCVDEKCDDGNTDDGDDCNSTCTAWTSCGDGVVQANATGTRPDHTAAEECDSPSSNPACKDLTLFSGISDKISGAAECYNNGAVPLDKKCKWNKGDCKYASPCNTLQTVIDAWDSTHSTYKQTATTYISWTHSEALGSDGTYHRTWDETTNDWSAATPELYYGGGTPVADLLSTKCYYKCNADLGWDGAKCSGRIDITQCDACDDENGVWNGGESDGKPCKDGVAGYQPQPLKRHSKIGSDGAIHWDKVIGASYNETETDGCFYKCKADTTYGGGKCNKDVIEFTCSGKPANTKWISVVKESFTDGGTTKWRRKVSIAGDSMTIKRKLQSDHETYAPDDNYLEALYVDYTHKDDDPDWKKNWKDISIDDLDTDTSTRCYFACDTDSEGNIYSWDSATGKCVKSTVSLCGNGQINREDCSLIEGNTAGNTTCVITLGANEVCDDGANNGYYKSSGAPSYCNSTCSGLIQGGTEYFCGDNVVQHLPQDGCYDTNCKPVTEGNYTDAIITDFTASEECDSSNNNNTTHLCDIYLKKQGIPTFSSYYGTGSISCNGCKISISDNPCGYCGDGVYQSDNETCENTSDGIAFSGGTFNNKSFTTKTFNTGSGSYTVPISGIYEIKVYGAKGGRGADGEDSNYCSGGDGKDGAPGGVVSAQFFIAKGQTLTIYGGTSGSNGSVRPGGSGGSSDGQSGSSGESNSWDGGGGGGGGGSSSVKIGSTTLVSAYGGGGGGGGEAGGSTIFCSSGYDGGSPNGSTGGAASGSNASKGGDGGKGGNGGGSNYYYSTTTGSSYRYYSSYSTSGTNSGAGKIEIKLIKYAPCKLDTCTFDETNLINIGKVKSKCTGLAEHAHWNGTGEIEQTYYSGSGWLPSTDGGWGSSTSGCYFQCDSGYEWSDYYGTWRCINIKTNVPCPMLPANAEYNTVDHITQTYTSSTWTPSADSISYSETPITNECRFKCKYGYTYDGGQCKNTKTVSCPALPTGAVYNTVSNITQNWTPENGWQPANTLTYNTTASSSYCRYKCNTNYTWSSSEQKCKADSHSADCTGLPANASWNTVSSITQTWNGSEWRPSPTGHYNTTASQTECRYKCNSGFHTEDSGSTCVSNERDVDCTGLPDDHAHWTSGGTGTKTIHQTWGSSWSPSTSASHNSSTAANQCYFQCNTNYEWNGSSCVAKTQPADCTGLPENAVWNTASSITQTWNENGSGCDGTNCWYPTTAGSYSTTASTTECKFRCKAGYVWLDSQCKQAVFNWGFESSDFPTNGWISQQSNTSWVRVNGSSSIPGRSSNLPAAKEGSYAMCSNIQGQTSAKADLLVNITVPAGFDNAVFRFSYVGTSEESYDIFQVFLDPTSTEISTRYSNCANSGSEKVCTDGADHGSWTQAEMKIPAGAHTILFKYNTDSSNNYDADRYCIDNLELRLDDGYRWSFENDSYTTSGFITSISNSNSSYPWQKLTTLGAVDGNYAMCSTNYNVHSTDTSMTITVNLPSTGKISFKYKGTSEANGSGDWDIFRFYLDGTEKISNQSMPVLVSGTNKSGWPEWTDYQTPSLSAGTHTLKFQYKKDGSTHQPTDRYCIDLMEFTEN